MAFDISTAKPVSGGFDLSTAKPVASTANALPWNKSTGGVDTGGVESTRGAAAQTLRNTGAGLIRGAGSIGATIVAPGDMLNDALQGRGLSLQSNRERRDAMDMVLSGMGAHTDSTGYAIGKTGAEIAGTAGAGPAIRSGMVAVPFIANSPKLMALANAVGSGGMTAGQLPTNATLRAGAGNLATRVAGGAIAGAAQAGLIDPEQATTGTAIGGALPVGLKVAGKVGGAIGGGMSRASNVVKRMAASPVLINQVDDAINNALKGTSLNLGSFSEEIQNSIRADVAKAMQINGEISPDAVRRLADYRYTGTTPTQGSLTLDPAIITQQKNLAKLGANSKDTAAQQLARTENSNNYQLIDEINRLGANTKDDAFAGGQKVMQALEQRNNRAQELITSRYNLARATGGRRAALDPSAFTNRANDLLDDALLGGKLPGDVRNLLNKAATGNMPLTVDVAEQFKTRIGDLQRSTTDKAERKALGMVRQALDETPLLVEAGQNGVNVIGGGMGQASIDAFNKARKLNRAWMQVVEKTPALQAVRDGIEPDKFVQQFIVGNGGSANVADLQALRSAIRGNPEAMAAIKTQITAHLKNKALGGAADEVGNFSQSAYNKSLAAIGDRKLSMFFAPDEVQKLRAIGRVASYEQFQPKGSAVNNSNTAAAGISALFDKIADSPLLSKIPFGKVLAEPAQAVSTGIKAKNALNVAKSISAPREAEPSTQNALSRILQATGANQLPYRAGTPTGLLMLGNGSTNPDQ